MNEDILERLDEIIGQHAERMNGLQPAQACRFGVIRGSVVLRVGRRDSMA